MFSLSDDAGSTDDLPAADRAWLTRGEGAPARARPVTTVEVYAGEMCVVLAGLAVDRPEVRDAADFADLIASLDEATLVRAVVAEDLRDPDRRQLTEQAIGGDEAAIAELMAGLIDSPPGRQGRALVGDLPGAGHGRRSGPGGPRPAGWPLPADRGSRPGDDPARRRGAGPGDIATLRPTDLIERTTGGIRWLAESGVRRVILAPSYFARPYNFVLGGDDWRLFGYPIADDALDADDPLAPPAAVVRLHRALGDETRLRILRLLAGRDHYLTEIAVGARAVEADHQAPSRAPPGGRPGHPDRGGRPVVLQPPSRHDRGERDRDQRLPLGPDRNRPRGRDRCGRGPSRARDVR